MPMTPRRLLTAAMLALLLPVVRVLPDGTYVSVLVNPRIRRRERRDELVAVGFDSSVLDERAVATAWT